MIAEDTLARMEKDADAAKAELHLAAHVRALVVEVRELSSGARKRPTQEQVNAALAVFKDGVDKTLTDKARDVLDRFLS